MGVPVAVQLTDEVHRELEAQAQSLGVGLATLLSNLAAKAANDARRARIRADSARVAARVAADPEARAFFDDWGTPTAQID